MKNLHIGDLVQFVVPNSNPILKGWVYKDQDKKITVIPQNSCALITNIKQGKIDLFVPSISMNTYGWVYDVVKKIQ